MKQAKKGKDQKEVVHEEEETAIDDDDAPAFTEIDIL